MVRQRGASQPATKLSHIGICTRSSAWQPWHCASLDCDVSVGGNTARFKSKVLRHLVTIDKRFEVLVRLVKLWAKVQGLNSPQDGTFNSFCLNLMVREGWQCNGTFLV